MIKKTLVLLLLSNIFAQIISDSDERSRSRGGIFENLVQIQGQGKRKVLLKMKDTSRDRQGLVQALGSESYLNIERLGIYAKDLTYEELLEIEEYVDRAELDEDVYTVDNEYTDESFSNVEARIYSRGKMPWGIAETLQNKKFWSSKVPSGSMKICVVDTGYDFGHDDLPRGADVTGKNTPDINEKWYYDGNGHGTHVAGTIAALGGNLKGVRGIIPNNMDGKFKLIIGKAFNETGVTSESKVLNAVENCVLKGANVINLSLGTSLYYETSAEYYHDLYYNQGILLVAAAGNQGDSSYKYPASYPTVISVAAIKRDFKHAKFSNANDQVELSAPGTNIKSTYRKNKYERSDGTSMASPHIAGIAGLLWMHFPNCTNHQIRNVLAETALDIASSGCDNKTGFGFVQSIDAYDVLSMGNCGQYKSRSKNPGGGCDLDSRKVKLVGRQQLRQDINENRNKNG